MDISLFDLIEDDYALRKLAYEIENNIEIEFNNENIKTLVRCEIIKKNSLDNFLTVEEFILQYPNASFLANIIYDDDISLEIVEKVFSKINIKYPNIYLKSIIYALKKEDFNKCYETIETLPFITKAILEKYDIQNEYIMRMYQGNIEKLK